MPAREGRRLFVRALAVRAGGFVLRVGELEVPAGAYCVVLGPSGSGKTMLLEALAGTRPALAGTILLGDERIDQLPPHRRRVAMVFQGGGLFPHLSVRENLLYGLPYLPPEEVSRALERLSFLVESLGMAHLTDREDVTTLSAGEVQRVAVARALLLAPGLLLLDEPLSSLDAPLRREVGEVLRRVCRDSGVTVLHVTHDVDEALRLADLVVVLREGMIEQISSPDHLMERPASVFTARLAGFDCIVGREEGPDGEVLVRMARSSSIRMVRAGEAGGGGCPQGASFLGTARLERVIGDLDGCMMELILEGDSLIESDGGRLLVRRPGARRCGFAPGDVLVLSVAEEDCIVVSERGGTGSGRRC